MITNCLQLLYTQITKAEKKNRIFWHHMSQMMRTGEKNQKAIWSKMWNCSLSFFFLKKSIEKKDEIFTIFLLLIISFAFDFRSNKRREIYTVESMAVSLCCAVYLYMYCYLRTVDFHLSLSNSRTIASNIFSSLCKRCTDDDVLISTTQEGVRVCAGSNESGLNDLGKQQSRFCNPCADENKRKIDRHNAAYFHLVRLINWLCNSFYSILAVVVVVFCAQSAAHQGIVLVNIFKYVEYLRFIAAWFFCVEILNFFAKKKHVNIVYARV